MIFHEHDLGITETVNDGINAARGKFIAQIDSDGLWVQDKLQKQLAVLKSNENVLVWSEGQLVDQEGRSKGMSFSRFCNSVLKKKSGYIFDDLALQGGESW